jgi:hypothetical protein
MSKFSFGSKEKCAKCQKIVYPDDRLSLDAVILHASCFKCEKCKCKLNPGSYAALEGVYYCKPHFKEAFTLKGRYDFAEKGTATAEAAKQDAKPAPQPASAPVAQQAPAQPVATPTKPVTVVSKPAVTTPKPDPVKEVAPVKPATTSTPQQPQQAKPVVTQATTPVVAQTKTEQPKPAATVAEQKPSPVPTTTPASQSTPAAPVTVKYTVKPSAPAATTNTTTTTPATKVVTPVPATKPQVAPAAETKSEKPVVEQPKVQPQPTVKEAATALKEIKDLDWSKIDTRALEAVIVRFETLADRLAKGKVVSTETSAPAAVPAEQPQPAATKAPAPAKKVQAKTAVVTPKCAFNEEKKKWEVQGQENNQEIVINVTDIKQAVYIYRCTNSLITIKGKVNNITIDNCKKTGVVFDTSVSSVDVVNCSSLQIQVQGTVPTIQIDKTDGCHVFLSQECYKTVSIVTSKSSEMNVTIPTANDDVEEIPIAEQFETTLDAKSGKFVTRPTSHI